MRILLYNNMGVDAAKGGCKKEKQIKGEDKICMFFFFLNRRNTPDVDINR